MKKLFDIVFNPKSQPGYQTRHKSLDSLMGGAQITGAPVPKEIPVGQPQDLRKKFASGQVTQLNPSSQRRRK